MRADGNALLVGRSRQQALATCRILAPAAPRVFDLGQAPTLSRTGSGLGCPDERSWSVHPSRTRFLSIAATKALRNSPRLPTYWRCSSCARVSMQMSHS